MNDDEGFELPFWWVALTVIGSLGALFALNHFFGGLPMTYYGG